MRELLKEARDDLVWIAGAYSDDKSMADNAAAAYEMSCTAKRRIERIDAALAAPKPDAMERRVPRAMLEELCDASLTFTNLADQRAKTDAVIAKYGYRAE